MDNGAAAPPRAASLGVLLFFFFWALNYFLPWPRGGAPAAEASGRRAIRLLPHDNMYGSVDILGSTTPLKLLPKPWSRTAYLERECPGRGARTGEAAPGRGGSPDDPKGPLPGQAPGRPHLSARQKAEA